MFALSVTALLAIVGLLYSFGFVLAERRGLQTAADAASLRGAWQVLAELQQDEPGDVDRDSRVQAEVVRYAASNGVSNPGDVSAVYVTGAGAATGSTVGAGVLPAGARGVRVTVRGQAATLLPGFVGRNNVLVSTSSSAAAIASGAAALEAQVIPIAVHVDDVRAAFRDHTEYDLFDPPTPPLDLPPTLNLLSVGATNYGPPSSTNFQYWSDGQHANGTVTIGSDVAVSGTEDYDDIGAGLLDNIRRQDLHDSGGRAYGIFIVPVWDAPGGPGTVNVVGFAWIKVLATRIDGTSAAGFFVPYPVAAFGALSTPTDDLGGVLVRILP